jgi:hypothetical protein
MLALDELENIALLTIQTVTSTVTASLRSPDATRVKFRPPVLSYSWWSTEEGRRREEGEEHQRHSPKRRERSRGTAKTTSTDLPLAVRALLRRLSPPVPAPVSPSADLRPDHPSKIRCHQVHLWRRHTTHLYPQEYGSL